MDAAELQHAALEALLERSGRDGVPIRRSFTQLRTRGGGAGPLAAFVTDRRRRALDLYLLLHAVASASPYDSTMESSVWARLLGMDTSSAGSMITRQWNWLEQRNLVASRRVERLRSLTLLREDGSGGAYTHPGLGDATRKPEGDYFTLPYAYWDLRLQDRIDLPTKAVLLIALSRPHDGFILPLEHASKWYGISADSLQTGIKNLLLLDLLSVELLHTPTPLGKRPYRTERRYTLRAPMHHPSILPAPAPAPDPVIDLAAAPRRGPGRRRASAR